MKKMVMIISIFVMSLAIAGCSTQQRILDLRSEMVPSGYSSATVGKVIKQAAFARGWNAKTVRPGLIKATLMKRTHSITVKIPYSAKSYSILYDGSINMNANGGMIHHNYNRWVSYLNQRIRRTLAGSAHYHH